MRRASLALAASAALFAVLASGALAKPAVTLAVHVQPIRGYPRTGSVAGEGASLLIEIAISGNEYGGGPPPLSHIGFGLAKGMRWSANGFPGCSLATVEPPAPGGVCPRGSLVLPDTSGTATVQFGRELVPENLNVESFDSSTATPTFEIAGRSPVSIEAFAAGSVANHGGKEELSWALPLVATMPGGLDASLRALSLRVGSAATTSRGLTFSLRMPAKCPRKGLRFTLQAGFAALGGLEAQTALASSAAPCRRH